MLDSTVAQDIPFSYDGRPMELVAGYVDDPRVVNGRWCESDWDRFPPHVRRVRVCIYTDRMDAHVIDVEGGNNDARQAVPWIKAKWERGETPTVYCFSDAGPKGCRISDVRRECDLADVKRPLIWITDWRKEWSDFDPTGDPSIIALQYAGSAKTGGHFDASAVADYWPGIDEEEGMNAEQVKALIRQMAKSPEGALLVREALARPADDPDAMVEAQLNDSEAAIRRWIVGL